MSAFQVLRRQGGEKVTMKKMIFSLDFRFGRTYFGCEVGEADKIFQEAGFESILRGVGREPIPENPQK
jgi:hypothetical protein